MFLGSIEHQLDGKNRIRIPKKFRKDMEGELYFMKYSGGCIAVLTRSDLDERLSVLKEIKSNQPKLLQAKRQLLASIEKIEEDDQGRIVLSASMREYAHITKDVVTRGVMDYVEIWSPEVLRKQDELKNDENTPDENRTVDIEQALLNIGI